MPLITYHEFPSGAQKGGSIREDLQDFISNVSPQETPLLSRLRQVGVDAGFVEWQVDQLQDAAVNAMVEGAAFTDQSLVNPQRASNLVQTFYKSGSISDRSRSVAHAGMPDPLVYHTFKKFVELKRDIELALTRGTAVSGTAGTAAQLNGFLSVLTNITASSGTTLTEAVFNDILELVYHNGSVNPSEVYAGSRIKRTISGFNTKNTFTLDANAREQVLTTDVYASDFGTLRIFPHRQQLRSASVTETGNSWIVIDPEYFQTGWLQPVRREVLSRDGLRTPFQLSAELTLIYRNALAGGGMSDCVAYVK